jgi:hypothetical protein
MKKLISVMFLIAVFALCGSVSAFAAVPVIDGVLGAGEWANVSNGGGPFPYYLNLNDPNELDNQIDTMDMSRVVLLQSLNIVDPLNPVSKDGIYLMIQVYDPAGPALGFPSNPGLSVDSLPTVRMAGDFLGDGLNDSFNIFVRTYNTVPLTGLTINDKTEVCVGSQTSCLVGGTWVDLVGAGGSFARGGVLEYFFPSATFGTPPNTPFPGSFIGTITYDNGASGVASADDVVLGTLVPEPTSMFLMFTGIIGLLAKKRFLA